MLGKGDKSIQERKPGASFEDPECHVNMWNASSEKFVNGKAESDTPVEAWDISHFSSSYSLVTSVVRYQSRHCPSYVCVCPLVCICVCVCVCLVVYMQVCMHVSMCKGLWECNCMWKQEIDV